MYRYDEQIPYDIESSRPDGAASWELPTWGHPLAQGITPLCIRINDHLFPMGTAFFLGSNPVLVVSAEHIIREAFKHERFGDRLLQMRQLPPNLTLKDVGFTVLHHRLLDNGKVDLTAWPLDQLNIAQPTDLVVCSPCLPVNLPTISFPLSFDHPRIGSKVHCLGYCDFTFPDGGIPMDSIRDGSFDWLSQYNHRFRVVEGAVRRLFTQRFINSFLRGACFSIDAEIDHGLSGGPVLTASGTICGVSAAEATRFFDEPASLISLLRPLLGVNVTYNIPIGPIRIIATHQFIELASSGNVLTDDSLERVSWTLNEAGSKQFDVWVHREDCDFAHDDFDGYQSQKGPTPATGPAYRFVKRAPDGRPLQM